LRPVWVNPKDFEDRFEPESEARIGARTLVDPVVCSIALVESRGKARLLALFEPWRCVKETSELESKVEGPFGRKAFGAVLQSCLYMMSRSWDRCRFGRRERCVRKAKGAKGRKAVVGGRLLSGKDDTWSDIDQSRREERM